MQFFIVFAAVVATTIALPFGAESPVSVSQDTLGNYKLAYTLEDSARQEESLNGQVHGSYDFTDKEGDHHKVHYLAGKQGFLATGDIIPVAPKLTAEVAHAAHEHRVLFQEIAKDLPVLSLAETDPTAEAEGRVYNSVLPVHHEQVLSYAVDEVSDAAGGPEDTAEVAAIKAIHQVAQKHTQKYQLL